MDDELYLDLEMLKKSEKKYEYTINMEIYNSILKKAKKIQLTEIIVESRKSKIEKKKKKKE